MTPRLFLVVLLFLEIVLTVSLNLPITIPFLRSFTPSPGSVSKLHMLPKDIDFRADQLEVRRLIGKLDFILDERTLDEARQEVELYSSSYNQSEISRALKSIARLRKNDRVTSTRLFEARMVGGIRVYLKEFLPIGLAFGRRELKVVRTLTKRWNNLKILSIGNDSKDTPVPNPDPEVNSFYGRIQASARTLGTGESMSEAFMRGEEKVNENKDEEYMENMPVSSLLSVINEEMFYNGDDSAPFPLLLGSLRADSRVESAEFIERWTKQMPLTQPPAAGAILYSLAPSFVFFLLFNSVRVLMLRTNVD